MTSGGAGAGRTRTRPLAAVRALAVAVVVAGCGTDGDGSAGSAPLAAVTVTRDADGTGPGPAARARLTCRAGATDPPCRTLLALPADALAPPAAGRVCTEQFGGPQTGRITGTVRGRRVDARYARTDGCAIARWDRVAPVLARAR